MRHSRRALEILALSLALLAIAPGAVRAGSVQRIGPCVNPHCNVPPPNAGFVSVATGNYHSMGLRSDGSVAAWGMCDVGQCNVPLPNTGFVAISAGDSHSLGLKANGSVVAWGSNEYGELLVPSPNSGFVAIAAGLLHNLGLEVGGSIVGWGSDLGGAATPPAPNTGWVAIAAGGYYSIGLKADGSVRRWGCGAPCPVPSPNTGFVAVSTHFYHSLALKADGSIVAWGSNDFGQLDVPAPNTGFVAIAAGDSFSLGLKSDGRLVAWGAFDEGDIPPLNRSYLEMTANRGLGDALKGEGTDAAFGEAPPLTRRGQPQRIGAVPADVDGDGDRDLVVFEYGADTVEWFDNGGQDPPIWTPRVIDGGALGPQMAAVGDMDGDGDLDVLSANFNGDEVAWYANDGASPPGWTKRLLSFVTGPWSVHAADLDGDGDVDGIAGMRLNGPEHVGVEWYENDGAAVPSFTVRRVSAGFVEAASVEAADLDGDGDRDVLAVDVFSDRVLWFENGGQHPPVWTQRTLTTAVDDPWSVHPTDLDRDGDVDVLVASLEDDTVAWHENGGQQPPVWTRHVVTNAAPQPLDAVAADLDGDADLDVASAGWAGQVAWYENVGVGVPSFVTRVVSTACRGTGSIRAGRLDADADLDLVAGCETWGEVHWFPNLLDFAEADGDGVRDTLDCAPADPGAFALPGEVRDVRFTSPTGLTWSPAVPPSGTGTGHDVARGSVTQLPVGSGGEVCLADGATGTSLTVAAQPPAGSGFWYLVRAANACGAGTYGLASSGARTSAACP